MCHLTRKIKTRNEETLLRFTSPIYIGTSNIMGWQNKSFIGPKTSPELEGDVRGGILIEVDARRWAGLINAWVCSGTWWYCYDICACLMRTDFRNAFKRTSFSLRLKDALPEISKWYYHDLAPVNNNYCYQGKQLLGYNLTSRSTTACRWQFIEGKGGLPTFNNCLLHTWSDWSGWSSILRPN